jgi:hypothetical protein
MKFNLQTVVVIAVFHFGLVNEVSLLFGRQRSRGHGGLRQRRLHNSRPIVLLFLCQLLDGV